MVGGGVWSYEKRLVKFELDTAPRPLSRNDRLLFNENTENERKRKKEKAMIPCKALLNWLEILAEPLGGGREGRET